MTAIAVVLVVSALPWLQEANGARIEGRVVDDLGAPVPGVTVYLVGGPPPGARTAITNDSGAFALLDLSPSTYTIDAVKAGYPPVKHGQSRAGGTGEPIQVAPGQRVAIDVRMPRGAAIAGTVFDEMGIPLADRQVALSRATAAGLVYIRTPFVRSNAKGDYRAFGLEAGTYHVGAADPAASGPVTAQPTGSVVVTVTPGDDRQNVDLRAAAMTRTTHVVIRPVTPTGAAPRYPDVQLRRPGEAQQGRFSYGSRGADGTTTFSDVPAGRYRAVMRAGGLWGAADIEVDGEHPVSVTLALAPGTRIGGRVVFAGSIPRPARLSLHLVAADLEGLTGDEAGTLGQVAADGSFTIPNVPPGRFLIRPVGFSNTDPWSVESAMLGEIDAADVPLAVNRDPIEGVVVTMTDIKTRLRGIVTTGAGSPANGINLVVYPADARRRTRNSRRVATVKTSVSGEYEVTGLPPGDYSIAVVDAHDWERTRQGTFLNQPIVSTFSLAIGESKTHSFTLVK